MPLPLTVSCFSEIQIGFTFLVPAHLGSPGQRAVERVWSSIVWSYIDACWVWSVWWCMYQCVGVWQGVRWNEYFAVCARCFWWFISKLSWQNDDTFRICDIMFIWVISPERPSSAAYSMSSGVVMILMIFLTEIAIFRHQSFDFSKSKEILIKVKIAFLIRCQQISLNVFYLDPRHHWFHVFTVTHEYVCPTCC